MSFLKFCKRSLLQITEIPPWRRIKHNRVWSAQCYCSTWSTSLLI